MPDPATSPEEFAVKFTHLKEKILTDKFKGRIAFNVLGDISRFSTENISNIESAEKYLHCISSDKLKVFCSTTFLSFVSFNVRAELAWSYVARVWNRYEWLIAIDGICFD